MAATLVSSIVTQVRAQLVEPTARFWSDAELVSIMNLGVIDLWGAILDLHQDHYFKVNASDIYLRTNATEISGIPDDCFRVTLIEPKDTTSDGSGRQVIFTPRKYNHPDFVAARTRTAVDPSGAEEIFYQIVGQGAPNEAPKILTAPLISADLALRLTYCPSISIALTTDRNPVPGGSDNALKAWTIAYARAKETELRIPDPGWLGVYGAEKQTILTRLTPRQEHEPEVIDDLFQGVGHGW